MYGKFLLTQQTVLDAILYFDGTFGAIVRHTHAHLHILISLSLQILKIAIGIMVLHILSTLPLIMNPVFRFLELNVLAPTEGAEPRLVVRLFERCTVVALIILLALFVRHHTAHTPNYGHRACTPRRTLTCRSSPSSSTSCS